MGTTCSLSKVKDGGGGEGCFHGLTEVHRKLCALSEGATALETTADEARIDLSCFAQPRRVLGLGGFGCVRETTKVAGKDKGKRYALKSLAKQAVLARSSGVSSVLSELRALAVLVDAPFVCCVHYAFQVRRMRFLIGLLLLNSPQLSRQDDAFLFMVLDLAVGGDMRFNLKCAPYYRFSEMRARFYIAQVVLAVGACHGAAILHRDIKPGT